MGCVKSKNKSKDEIYTKKEMEGRSGRFASTRKSNESLIITVLWRRLSMFSRRGSTRKQSSTVKFVSVQKSQESHNDEVLEQPSKTEQEQQRLDDSKLPKLKEEEEKR
ncbi:testis-expressed protein 54-like [Sarcophilus harrisii]|uniref:testis-expressed protein 54-like n=1 Tax=Sarcophilus harrisii TaxID=9305 RepID=UPI000273C5C8|nr:testis-expressed protein 54-like [Sarcophilus harrisii]